MTDRERAALARLIKTEREKQGLSARELARRAGIDQALLTLIDQRKIAQPRIETIQRIAEALDLSVTDLYTVANWLPERDLPGLGPYMRAKYRDLPDEGVEEVERFVAYLRSKYGAWPQPGEDE